MGDLFERLGLVENPREPDLEAFVDEVVRMLEVFLDVNRFDRSRSRIWRGEYQLERDATEAFHHVSAHANQLKKAIPGIPYLTLRQHGLVGDEARFTYHVMRLVSSGWGARPEHYTMAAGLRPVFTVVGTHLQSLIAAAGGVGGAIREYMDTLEALVPDA